MCIRAGEENLSFAANTTFSPQITTDILTCPQRQRAAQKKEQCIPLCPSRKRNTRSTPWHPKVKYKVMLLPNYSLSQNCGDTFVSSRPLNVGLYDLVTEIAINNIGRKEKTAFGLSVPTTFVWVWSHTSKLLGLFCPIDVTH